MKHLTRVRIAAAIAVSVLTIGGIVLDGFSDLELMKVALSLTAFVLSATMAVISVLFLVKRDERLDRTALAAGKAGLFATTLALIATCAHHRTNTGSFWVWEVGAGMLLVIWLVHLGYFLLRSSAETADRAARFAAVFVAITTVDSPFLYLAIRSFVAGVDGRVPTFDFAMDAAGAMVAAGLFLSFFAGMLYLYGLEGAGRASGPVPVSSTSRWSDR